MVIEQLLSIRWATIAAYLAVWIIGVGLLGASWWQEPMVMILAVIVLSNYTLHLLNISSLASTGQPLKEKLVAIGILFVDILMLSIFLYFYGGYTNPFATMFLVYTCIAALLLSAAWTWIVFIVSSLLYGALFFWHIPIPALSAMEHGGAGHHHHGHGVSDGFSAHLYGMLFSFLVTGVLITFFLTKMRRNLDQRQAALLDLQQKALTQQSLARISALTAQSAHELSTPIATMSLIAESLAEPDIDSKEKKQQIASLQGLIFRCRKILNAIRERFQASADENATSFSVRQLLEGVLNRLAEIYPDGTPTIETAVNLDTLVLVLPRTGLELSLTALVDNAAKYGKGLSTVTISIKQSRGQVAIYISDEGPGIKDELTQEPMLSTGLGLGVGIFLARQYLMSINATLRYAPRSPVGTTAIIELPYER